MSNLLIDWESMRICIDTRMSRSWDAGTGRLAISLLDKLTVLDNENEYVVLHHAEAADIPVQTPHRFQFRRERIEPASLSQLAALPIWLRKNGIDLILNTHPLSMVIWEPCHAIGAILDLLPIHFPDHFPRGLATYFKTIVRLSARLKDAIITISNHSRNDIIAQLKLRPDQVRVIHLAASEQLRHIPNGPFRQMRLAHYGIDRPYILYHGNTRQHKNLISLLRAYALLLQKNGPSHELVLTGREVPAERERNFDAIRLECIRLDIADHVRFTGYIEEPDLASVYSGASVFVMPSLYEGFGLPVIEAMACATPVVCSNTSSLPEVAGDAALFVSPTDPALIADAILMVLEDEALSRDLASKGIEQSRRFSWDRSARQLLDLFYSISDPNHGK